MRVNANLRTVKADSLILPFGSTQLKRIGMKGRRRIAVRVRILGRLLEKLRTTVVVPTNTLSDFLDGKYFDAFIDTVEELCGMTIFEDGKRVLTTPSLALMIGNIVPKCCQTKKRMGIRRGDEGRVK